MQLSLAPIWILPMLAVEKLGKDISIQFNQLDVIDNQN